MPLSEARTIWDPITGDSGHDTALRFPAVMEGHGIFLDDEAMARYDVTVRDVFGDARIRDLYKAGDLYAKFNAEGFAGVDIRAEIPRILGLSNDNYDDDDIHYYPELEDLSSFEGTKRPRKYRKSLERLKTIKKQNSAEAPSQRASSPLEIREDFKPLEMGQLKDYFSHISSDYVRHILEHFPDCFTIERNSQGFHRVKITDMAFINIHDLKEIENDWPAIALAYQHERSTEDHALKSKNFLIKKGIDPHTDYFYQQYLKPEAITQRQTAYRLFDMGVLFGASKGVSTEKISRNLAQVLDQAFLGFRSRKRHDSPHIFRQSAIERAIVGGENLTRHERAFWQQIPENTLRKNRWPTPQSLISHLRRGISTACLPNRVDRPGKREAAIKEVSNLRRIDSIPVENGNDIALQTGLEIHTLLRLAKLTQSSERKRKEVRRGRQLRERQREGMYE